MPGACHCPAGLFERRIDAARTWPAMGEGVAGRLFFFPSMSGENKGRRWARARAHAASARRRLPGPTRPGPALAGPTRLVRLCVCASLRLCVFASVRLRASVCLRNCVRGGRRDGVSVCASLCLCLCLCASLCLCLCVSVRLCVCVSVSLCVSVSVLSVCVRGGRRDGGGGPRRGAAARPGPSPAPPALPTSPKI